MKGWRATLASLWFGAAVASCGSGSGDGDLTRTFEVLGGPLPDGRVGFVYAATLRAVGVDPEGLAWTSLSGLPRGLSLTPVPGGEAVIEGVPQEAGDYRLELLVVAPDGAAAELDLPLLIEDSTTLEIVEGELPRGRVGEAYEARVDARGGTGVGHRWRVSEGALPAGLELEGEAGHGVLVGTPVVEGSVAFDLEVTDSAGTRAARTFRLTIDPVVPGLSIRAPEPPGGAVDVPLDIPIEALEGRPPMQWQLSGEPVPGLSFEAGPSRIARLVGTPTQVGRYALGLSVADADGAVATETSTFIVAAPLVIDDAPLPAATLGEAYSASFVANEAGGEHRWIVAQGILPPGLSVVGDGEVGRLSGTPTSTGAFTFTVEVLDRVGQRAQRPVTLRVAMPLQPTVNLPSAVDLGDPLDAPVRVSGGRGPFTFTVVSGALPAGVRLLVSGGEARLVGPAGELGRFTFTIEVVDVDGRRARLDVSLEVQPSGVPLAITPPTGSLIACRGGALALETTGGSRFGLSWTVQSGLPQGLRLVPTTTTAAVLGGVPRAAGAYAVTVTVEDSSGARATATLPVVVTSDGAARWAVFDNATDAQGRTAAVLVDLCAPAPEVERTFGGVRNPSLGMSTDGRWLAIAHAPTSTTGETLRLLDLAAASVPEYSVAPMELAFLDFELDPNGQALYFVAARLEGGTTIRSVIQRVDLSTGVPGAPQTLFVGTAGEQLRLRALSPDGRWLAFGANLAELRVIDTSGGSTPIPMPGETDPIGFDANGDWFLYTEEDSARRDLARAYKLASTGPPLELVSPTMLHTMRILPGAQSALLYLDVSPPTPWIRYTFTPDELREEGPVPGTEVCGHPAALSARWIWCTGAPTPSFVDVVGGTGVASVPYVSQGGLGVSMRARLLLMQAELDPARGVETVAYGLQSLPRLTPRVLSPSPGARAFTTVDFAPHGARVLLEGRAANPSTLHDLSRPTGRTELWRGQAERFSIRSGWRNDGSGLFVDVVGQARWLDLSIPEAPRMVLPVAPPGVGLDSQLGRTIYVQPDP